MKSFYIDTAEREASPAPMDHLYIECRARVAVYDGPAAAPRIVDVGPLHAGEFIEALSSRVYELSSGAGGSIPYTVVREVAENLIHADFSEPVVSILDGGNTIRFADQGPGITDKERAVLPGFTTARGSMKRYIRGVGSGLPLVNDFLRVSGGHLQIEDNLGAGSVVTICSHGPKSETTVSVRQPIGSLGVLPAIAPTQFAPQVSSSGQTPEAELFPQPARSHVLGTRQKQVLAVVLESGTAGPSVVSKELGVGLSTAYRDLAILEEAGLIRSEAGKRTVTSAGARYLDDLMSAL